jgi:DcuC family C4-dicarboxylate transporter
MLSLVALLVVAASIALVARRVEIRLVLLGAGLVMATVAGRPLAIADVFGRSMVAAMVAPICAAMGFAAVLAETGCDSHLVNLLMRPLRRSRWAVLPGGLIAAYVVNLAVPSQASTAAMLGPILLPILLAAGLRPAAAGAALVLGSSFGGDLLSPGAQDVQALAGVTGIAGSSLSARIVPASLAGMLAATLTFSLRHGPPRDIEVVFAPPGVRGSPEPVNIPMAMIPLVPVTLLLLAHAGWRPLAWLVRVSDVGQRPDLAAALPVVRAMLVGCLLAAATCWRDPQRVVRRLFDGMGGAYRDIISLTITAQCFGAGLAAAGLGEALLRVFGGSRWALAALSVGFPWGLATLSGSGSGPVLAFAEVCLVPLQARGGVATLGALTCLSAAFGRTMSPVSAVVLCGSGLAGSSPIDLVRSLLLALLAGAAVSLGLVLLSAS